MSIFLKVLSWVWNIFQIVTAFAIFAFFFWPSAVVGGKEVVWLLWRPVPVEGEALGFWVFHFQLLTIVGGLAIIYVVVGLIQAAFIPPSWKWLRGFNWAASFVVAVPVVWTWWRIFTDTHYGITLFQDQILYMVTFAVALDVFMDLLVPWIKKLANRVAHAPAGGGRPGAGAPVVP